MYRRRTTPTGRNRKLIIGLAAVALAGGAFAVSTGVSSAGENCAGLDQALQNNLTAAPAKPPAAVIERVG
jgi:hypothetical protein